MDVQSDESDERHKGGLTNDKNRGKRTKPRTTRSPSSLFRKDSVYRRLRYDRCPYRLLTGSEFSCFGLIDSPIL